MAREIWTVGHSNRALADFLELLAGQAIECVADVRRFPGSRRHPQFGRDALEAALKRVQIGYRHFEALGGRRTQRRPGSPNTAWRVNAFNAYADHMLSNPFQAAIGQLAELAEVKRTAIMCAEALPWQCHRRLVSDALLARGWIVWNILAPRRVDRHDFTPFAHVQDEGVTYPGQPLFNKGEQRES